MTARFRIRSLAVENFRGIRRATFDCDADVVLFYARNGVGKTTIFEAIEYALFRCNARLQKRDKSTWEKYLPNVHGDGSFGVRLELDTGEVILDGIDANGNRHESRPEGTLADFVYKRLNRSTVLGRRSVAAVHDLMLATHLLMQNEMAELAASGTLDSQKLAALTGSGYFERCREKAAVAARELDSRIRRGAQDRGLAQAVLDQKTADATRLEKLATSRQTVIIELRKLEPHGLFPVSVFDTTNDAGVAVSQVSRALRQKVQTTDQAVATIRALLGTELDYSSADNAAKTILEFNRERADVLRKYEEAGMLVSKLSVQCDEKQEERAALERRSATVRTVLNTMSKLKELQTLLNLAQKEVTATQQQMQDAGALLGSAEERFRETQQVVATRRADAMTLHSQLLTLQDAMATSEKTGELLQTQSSNIVSLEERLVAQRANVAIVEGQAVAAKADFEQQHARFTAASSVSSQLLADLRATITASESDCPLCGTSFGAHEALIEAINRYAGRRSAEEAAMMQALDEARRLAQTLEVAHRRLLASIQRDTEELAVARDEQRQTRAHYTAAQQHVAAVVVDRDPAKVLHGLARMHEEASQVLATAVHDTNVALAAVDDARRAELTASSQSEVRIAARDRLQARAKVLAKEVDVILSELDLQASDEESLQSFMTELSHQRDTAERTLDDLMARLASASSSHEMLTQRLVAVENQLRREQERLDAFNAARERRRMQLKALGVPDDIERSQLTEMEATLTLRLDALRTASDLTEELARIEASPAYRDGDATNKEVAAAALKLAELESSIAVIDNARGTALRWERNLRQRVGAAIQDFVLPRQEEINRIFRSLIPNPFRFQRVTLSQGEDGDLKMGLVFRNSQQAHGSPEFYLSAAQMSVLALSIFLALSRSESWSNMDTMFLDDPVQHLDDLDSVALLDGLRAVARQKNAKQVMITTCDRSLYYHMIRKFSGAGGTKLIAMTLEEDLSNGVNVHYDFGGSEGSPAVSTSNG